MKRVGFPSQGPFINNVEHIVKHKALYELALRDYLTAKKIVLAETIHVDHSIIIRLNLKYISSLILTILSCTYT